MKELLAGFAVEIFRPVVTLLIPGFWALTPWTVAMFLHYPISWTFACLHRDGSALVFVVVATAVGVILEDLGARLEVCISNRQTKSDSINWYDYLALALEREPIGLRYIRTVVLRMKFELGMGLAGIAALFGIICIPVSIGMKSISLVMAGILTAYFLYESSCSIELLEKTRVELLRRISPKPAGPNDGMAS